MIGYMKCIYEIYLHWFLIIKSENQFFSILFNNFSDTETGFCFLGPVIPPGPGTPEFLKVRIFIRLWNKHHE